MKAGTATNSSKSFGLKRTKHFINQSFVTLCLTVFLATTYFLLPSFGSSVQSKQESLKDLIQNLLTNPSAFAQEAGDLAAGDQLTPSGYLNPLLPDDLLPDFSINYACNSSQTSGKRTVEFYYDNRTEYRINLDKSTVRVGKLDIDPYSVLDAKKVEQLKKAGIGIVHTHFNSDLFVKEVITTDASNNQVITLEYKSRPEVLALPEPEQDQWQSAGNNGPLDYLNPGRNTSMILEVPYNETVVWTAGVSYSDAQKELDGGKNKYQKTTTASTKNLKTCKEKTQAPNALSIFNAPRTPQDLELGRLTALTTTDDRTTSCRAENFLKGLNTKEVIGKGNAPLTLDYGRITTVGLGNRNMVTGSSDGIKNLHKNLKPGTYTIALQTSENHKGVNKPQDVNESVFVQLFDKDKTLLVSSNATYDLGDTDNNLVQAVNINVEIPAEARYYKVLHNSQGANAGSAGTEALGPTNAQEVKSLNELGEEVKTLTNQTPTPFVVATDPATNLPYNEFTSSNSIQAVCASFGYHRPVITIANSVLECISAESNKALAQFKADPKLLASPNVMQTRMQDILQSCVGQEILIQYTSVFNSINENQVKGWYTKYAQDGAIAPEEVLEAAQELADKNEIRLIVGDSVPVQEASTGIVDEDTLIQEVQEQSENQINGREVILGESQDQAGTLVSLMNAEQDEPIQVSTLFQPQSLVPSTQILNARLGPVNPQAHCDAGNLGEAYYVPEKQTWYCRGFLNWDLTKGLHVACTNQYNQVTAVSYLVDAQTGYTECYTASYIYSQNNQILNMEYGFREIYANLANEDLNDFNQKFLVTTNGQIIHDRFCVHQAQDDGKIGRGFCDRPDSFWSRNTDNTISNQATGDCFTASSLTIDAEVDALPCQGLPTQYWLVSGVGAGTGLPSNPGNGGGQPPIEEDPDDVSYISEESVADDFFELEVAIDDPSVWDSLKQIPESFVQDLDGFVYGDFSLDCGPIGFLCKSLLSSAVANSIVMVAQFLWGILEGMATFFTDIIDLIKMLWNIKDTISGLWGMIKTIFTDPFSLFGMIWDYVADFIAKPIVEKIKFVGFIIGEQLKDSIVAFFTGGAGLAAKIGGVLTDVVDTVKTSSKVLGKGINAAQKLVGNALNFGNDVKLNVTRSVSGAVGIVGSGLTNAVKKATPKQFDDMLKKLPPAKQAVAREIRQSLSAGCELVGQGPGCVTLKRKGNYRGKLQNQLLDENPLFDTRELQNLQANHRFPIFVGKRYPEASTELIQRYGLTDVSDTKMMDFITPEANRRHWRKWDELLAGYPNPTADDLAAIFRQVEADPTVYQGSPIYKSKDAINP